MKKKEFLDLLRFYLKDMPSVVIDDIISDYEEHFNIAMQNGKSEESICIELGSPNIIAEEYIKGEKKYPLFKNVPYEKDAFEKEKQKEKAKKKSTSNILIVLLILAGIAIISPILEFIVGIVLAILGIIFFIPAIVIGLVLLVPFLGIAAVGLAIAIILSIFSIPIFIPLVFLAVSPITSFFLSVAILAIGILILLFGVELFKNLCKAIKKIFITIKWEFNKRRF